MSYDNKTGLLGLIGLKLDHTLSPLMQNHTLQQMSLNHVYLPFEVDADRLQDAIAGIRALGIIGVNVTIPYKETVAEYLDELDDSAADCGAVNVIHNRNGHLVGFNTDGAGFILALQDAGYCPVSCVLLIGSGGAARSLSVALAHWGIREFIILEHDLVRAEALQQLMINRFHCLVEVYASNQENFALQAGRAGIIINCSPVGMYPHTEQSPVESFDTVSPGTVICDLIYNPLETRFLRIARHIGLATMNGVGMLANQGALSLEIWCGKPAPRVYMQNLLEEALK